jgi:hypothetical protein
VTALTYIRLENIDDGKRKKRRKQTNKDGICSLQKKPDQRRIKKMEEEMKEMKDKTEQEKREADKKREELQSSKDKTAISKNKNAATKSTAIAKVKKIPKRRPHREGINRTRSKTGER